MDKASEIVKTASINDLIYYIEYVEILTGIMQKRNIKDLELDKELLILTTRYNELLKEKNKKSD